VPEKGGKGKNYAVYKKEKTAKAKLKLAVDTLIPQVSDFEELLGCACWKHTCGSLQSLPHKK